MALGFGFYNGSTGGNEERGSRGLIVCPSPVIAYYMALSVSCFWYQRSTMDVFFVIKYILFLLLSDLLTY